MQLVSSWMSGPVLPQKNLVQALESLTASGDRVVEGDNQKTGRFPFTMLSEGRSEETAPIST
jgi:hypothetical protein